MIVMRWIEDLKSLSFYAFRTKPPRPLPVLQRDYADGSQARRTGLQRVRWLMLFRLPDAQRDLAVEAYWRDADVMQSERIQAHSSKKLSSVRRYGTGRSLPLAFAFLTLGPEGVQSLHPHSPEPRSLPRSLPRYHPSFSSTPCIHRSRLHARPSIQEDRYTLRFDTVKCSRDGNLGNGASGRLEGYPHRFLARLGSLIAPHDHLPGLTSDRG